MSKKNVDDRRAPPTESRRAAQGNRSTEITDLETRAAVRELTFERIGKGEKLA